MRRLAPIAVGMALLTVGFAGPAMAADDESVQLPFDAYIDAANEEGIEGEERTFAATIPADMGLLVEIDLPTFEVTTSPVDPTITEEAHDDNDPNCLVLGPGEEAGLTPGSALHVYAGDAQPEDTNRCQSEDAVHTTGTDNMQFVTAGDDAATFRLQRDFDQGWGWVWIDCETGSGVNFAIGPYDDLTHVDCYVNNYGDPTEWTSYEAWVENDHTAGFAYGSMSYVS